MLYEYINNSKIYLTEIMYKRYYWIICQTKLYINVYDGLIFENDLDLDFSCRCITYWSN